MTGSYKVNLEDKFSLDYILIKHYQLWQDINQNRKIYVGSLSDSDWLFEAGFNEEEYERQRKEHIDSQLELIGPIDKRSLVKETLKELFPQLKHILDGLPKSSENLIKLQQERRVTHPDVLDTYFGSSVRDEVYTSENKLIKEKLGNADKQSDSRLNNNFKDIIRSAVSSEDTNSDFTTLVREFLLNSFEGKELFRILRIWLRAYLSDTGYLVREDNGVLVRILSSINTAVERMRDIEEKQQVMDDLFLDIEKYIKHPSSALRMLLYIHPSRDNHFFGLRDYQKMNNLFDRVLKFVDSYYLNDGNDVYREGPGVDAGDWRFIIYQWALSISNNGKIDTVVEVEFPQIRYENVNKYIFKLLDSDDDFAYRVIHKQFWGTNIYDVDDKEKWVIAGNIDAYDSKLLLKLANKLISRGKLSSIQLASMREFLKQLNAYLADNSSVEQTT